MRLEKLEDKLLIWETGRQKNGIIYDSLNEDLVEYYRDNLAGFEIFLRKKEEHEEADKLKKYLGKILRISSIPQRIPTGTYIVNSMLEYLEGSIDRYKEEYGLDLSPDFQRGHVWNEKQRVSYVEFVLQDGKSNPIYLNAPNWNDMSKDNMVIVDGKQRLTSLLMFLNNEFTVFKELDADGVGYYAKEFNRIPNDIVIVINDLPTRKQVLQWYLEMNEGNVAHTTEELDNVRNLLANEM